MDKTQFSQIFNDMMNMGKYVELYSKIHEKFRSNLNLLSNLNEKYAAKLYIYENLHHIRTFQFNSMIFHYQMKNQLF